MKKLFVADPRVRFVDLLSRPLRAVQVNLGLVRGERLDNLLPEPVIAWLHSDPERSSAVVTRYQIALREFLAAKLELELGSRLRADLAGIGLSAYVSPETWSLMSQIQESRAGSLNSFINGMIRRENIRDSFAYQKLHDLFTHPEYLEIFRAIDLTSQLAWSAPVREQTQSSRLLARAIRFSFALGKWLNPLKSALLDFSRVHFPENPVRQSGSELVTVYRGVRHFENKNMDELIRSWKENGMFSKVALGHILKGESVGSALRASEQSLKAAGHRQAVLNHIFGDWRYESSLISTTLDPQIARAFAREGGYVLEIRVPRDRVVFVNDPVFWQDTVWQRKGNPRAELAEVAVEHIIRSEEIVRIERVEPGASSQGLHSMRPMYSESMKGISWIWLTALRQKFNDSFRPPAPRCEILFNRAG